MTASQSIVEKQLQLKKLLVSLMKNEKESSFSLQQKAILLARHLQQRATELQTPQERKQQAEFDRMIQNPQDKVTLMQMTDQTFRSDVPQRAVDQLIHILDVQGIPRFFSRFDRTLLRGFQSFGDYLPGVAVPLVKEKMHKETANVVLPAEKEMLAEHLNARRDEGVRMNVNFLGEALLGEEEAEQRLKSYLQALQMDETEVISVKISTIYSQITPLSRANAVAVLSDRMELLYRASAKAKFERNDGSIVPKFVYLDMEEYRDIGTTAEVFMKTLDRAGLENVSAGIALQAYIPDSYLVQQEITAWAKERVTRGGASVTIRVVKGANMEMERMESSIHGLEQPPYQKKIETDANYKRMLQFGMQAENLNAVRIGIASHNLFDLAYGLVLAVEEECLHRVQFEMLEGMANHQRRALFELTSNMLLYAPACKGEDFINAIGYLIRRLDENTGPENFLRHAFKIEVGSEEWKQLETGFLKSFDLIETLQMEPRRSQNRLEPQHQPKLLQEWREFQNEADTDFSLPNNLQWAKEIMKKWEPLCGEQAIDIPLVVAGKEIFEERAIKESLDPSRPSIIVGRY
ncbi:Proline dehydrogenase / Delta-1-pyrroline-5-carboxylate dehydrogenase, partial [hydrothermal vent metagenome]